jgi:predicted RNase H-like HicB family nuclease
MGRTYRVVLDPDPEEGGFTVTVPALPGVVTQGETVEQCRERVREAIALHLNAAIAPQQITVVWSRQREHSHDDQVRNDRGKTGQASSLS